jgi:hypothetical protein
VPSVAPLRRCPEVLALVEVLAVGVADRPAVAVAGAVDVDFEEDGGDEEGAAGLVASVENSVGRDGAGDESE